VTRLEVIWLACGAGGLNQLKIRSTAARQSDHEHAPRLKRARSADGTLRLAAAWADVDRHQHLAAALIALGHLEFHGGGPFRKPPARSEPTAKTRGLHRGFVAGRTPPVQHRGPRKEF